MQTADTWLKDNIGPLLATPPFQPGGDGLLIIWADEADLGTDNRCSATVNAGCGGRIVVAMIGPQVKSGYKSVTNYHHQSVLRTMLEAVGTVSNFPGAANTAADMREFFKGSTGAGTAGAINILAPINATIASPMRAVADASAPNPIIANGIYVDNVSQYLVKSNHVDTLLPISKGNHLVVFPAWDSKGNVYKSGKTVTVQ